MTYTISRMKHIEGFDHLGLSTRDSRVYVALLKNGVSSIRTISDITGINRGSTYESLKALISAGLVSFQQKNVNKKYFAEDPSIIFDIIAHRREALDEFEKTTRLSVPYLSQAAAHMPYANIKFYEDHEGVTVILRDVLDTMLSQDNKEYLAISSKPMRQYLYKKFPNFTRQRIQRNIFVKVIALGSGGDEAAVSERKWLPTKSKTQPSSYTLIYGNKFAMIGLNDNFNPYGIVIEDAGVAEMQRLLFMQLWQGL